MNRLSRNLAVGAVLATTAAAPAVANAEQAIPSKKLHKHVATKVLEKRTEKALDQQKWLPYVYGGWLTMRHETPSGGAGAPNPGEMNADNGGTVAPNNNSISYIKADEPFMVFRGQPGQEAGHTDFRNGDYAFGCVSRTGHPHVKLYLLNENTTLNHEGGSSKSDQIRYVLFEKIGDNTFNWNNPEVNTDGIGGHGGPANGPNNEQENIALCGPYEK